MALPDFLGRAATAASQVLQGYSRELFEEILLSHHICLAFDHVAISNKEGIETLDLAVRLLARLYPNLQIHTLSSGCDEHQIELERLAKSINPKISVEKKFNPTLFLVVGTTIVETNVPAFYVGSENWIVKFSDQNAVGSGTTNNPLAAGAAACFGVANIFREVFKAQLPNSRTDTAFSLSLIDYQLNSNNFFNPVHGEIAIGDIHLVGLGAIGNGFIWAFSRASFLQGNLHLIDGEKVDFGNLQRYILTSHKSEGVYKTKIAKDTFKPSKLKVKGQPLHWGPYLEKRNNWTLDKVAVAVDSAEDRIAIQSSLPQYIYNAWTQTNDMGVSRHPNFIQTPCLACLYLPVNQKINPYQEIACNLGLNNLADEQLIRDYLALNKPVDEHLLQKIAIAKSIPLTNLLPYIGEEIQNFYSQMVCGEMLLDLTQENLPQSNVEVPLAFQSALAGIMLASEVIIDAGNFRSGIFATRTRFNLLKPITKHNSEDCDKLINSNCLCQDESFKEVYLNKYNL